uniref:Uncharacterized protein n=1 Tax=Timema bartmani TaxID=61472 RepID=A0A7R9EQG7_9NEOP|nr:unnamed protein product [Timema bartmani]
MAPQVTSRVQPLEEDPVIVKESISTLRELVAAEPKLHVRTDDLFMMKYLRCADLDPQRAFQRNRAFQLASALGLRQGIHNIPDRQPPGYIHWDSLRPSTRGSLDHKDTKTYSRMHTSCEKYLVTSRSPSNLMHWRTYCETIRMKRVLDVDMKQYYKLKANCKDWFASTSPREQKEVLQQHITTMLRERDCYGRRVLICKLGLPRAGGHLYASLYIYRVSENSRIRTVPHDSMA